MRNLFNWKVDLFRHRPIAAFSVGLCAVVMQLSCSGTQSQQTSMPTPSATSSIQTSDQGTKSTGEGKLTATGIDSMLISYEFVETGTPDPGVFAPVPKSTPSDDDKEIASGKIESIQVYDNLGDKTDVSCSNNKPCNVEIKGTGFSPPNIKIEDVVVGADKKVLLTYMNLRTANAKKSHHNNWRYARRFTISSISVNGEKIAENCNRGSRPEEKCSVGINYSY